MDPPAIMGSCVVYIMATKGLIYYLARANSLRMSVRANSLRMSCIENLCRLGGLGSHDGLGVGHDGPPAIVRGKGSGSLAI